MQLIDKIIELRKQIYEIQYDLYMHHTLFSFKWWVMLLTALLLWFIWWKLVDKKRFHEIALTGFVAAIITTILDTTGLEMVLWAYPSQLFGLVRHISEMELVIIPISYMLLYQYFSEWRKYIIALVIFSTFGAFIAIPLAVRFEVYKIINWKYIYSFVTFILMGVMIKFIVAKVMNVQKRSL
jgi:hypothetical protein